MVKTIAKYEHCNNAIVILTIPFVI